MKLRNKKTGDIVEVLPDSIAVDVLKGHENITAYYTSLAELNTEWEDYEEPKEYYYIDCDGTVMIDDVESTTREWCIEIGNYFETKEEAEKAVEKLKAWKRLKDNGFKFEGVEKRGRYINFYQSKSYETDKQCQQAIKDLDLLFGDEE